MVSRSARRPQRALGRVRIARSIRWPLQLEGKARKSGGSGCWDVTLCRVVAAGPPKGSPVAAKRGRGARAPRQAFAFPAVGQRRGSRGSWEGGRDRWLAPARDPPASAQGLRAGWPAGRARRRDAVCLAASGARVANPDRVAGRFCFSLFLLSAWLSCVRACRERRWPEPKADQQPVAHAPLHRWPGRLTTTSGKGLKGQWKERTLWRMLSVPVAR